MIQRFFFDGINLQGGRRTITQAIELSAAIHSNKTEAALSLADVAMPRAQVAMNAAIRIALPPLRFMQSSSFVKDRERSHTYALLQKSVSQAS
jgi:hypothetical protein